jgi:nucleoside-diphosphate-sugar epimerase
LNKTIIKTAQLHNGEAGEVRITHSSSAMNTVVPAHIAERFSTSRIAVLSSGNVDPLDEPRSGGAVEADSLTPVGEYANACVARERVFEFFSQKNGTAIVCLRLNYAVDLRYGVLVDIAEKVHAGRPVELSTGYFNCIWQGDANEFIIRSLGLATTPATALNLTGPAVLSVREVALQFGKLFVRPVQFVGVEGETALLNNPNRLCQVRPFILFPCPTAPPSAQSAFPLGNELFYHKSSICKKAYPQQSRFLHVWGPGRIPDLFLR